VQILLQPFAGSIQEYDEEIADPSRYRPDHCPQCQAAQGLTAHGFYRRTLVDAGFDGSIRVRRYLCRFCRRTVSLLPQFALPYLRFSVTVMALFLMARLRDGHSLLAAAAFGRATEHALPARSVLGTPVPEAGRGSVRGAGGVDRTGGGLELRRACLAHAAGHRLDQCPPLSVCRSAIPLVRLAGVSRSTRAGSRGPAGDAARLRPHT